MSKQIIDLLKKRLIKYNIELEDDEIIDLGVTGVIDIIIKYEE
ncbi:hypothetical protein ACFL2A_00335 [Thermodesulfobacteriota bacterium]